MLTHQNGCIGGFRGCPVTLQSICIAISGCISVAPAPAPAPAFANKHADIVKWLVKASANTQALIVGDSSQTTAATISNRVGA
jgi:uncharacterized protein YceK